MKTYPICLIGLEQQRSVVIGGGAVAARKTQALLSSGARITVISPEISSPLQTLFQSGEIEWLSRPYVPGDLEGAFLVISATDNPEVNAAVWQEAQRLRLLVNVVDDPQHSNFILPAVVQRGELSLMISTGGASPALARRLRERLEASFGPEWGELAAILGALRPELLARFAPGQPRLEAALQLVDSELLEVIRRDGEQAGKAYARCLLEHLAEQA